MPVFDSPSLPVGGRELDLGVIPDQIPRFHGVLTLGLNPRQVHRIGRQELRTKAVSQNRRI